MEQVAERRRPLDDDELVEIEARARAAAPGPWSIDGPYIDGDGQLEIGTLIVDALDDYVCQTVYDGQIDLDFRTPARVDADTRFIAHAREDVPILVAEVRHQREIIRVHVKCPCLTGGL